PRRTGGRFREAGRRVRFHPHRLASGPGVERLAADRPPGRCGAAVGAARGQRDAARLRGGAAAGGGGRPRAGGGGQRRRRGGSGHRAGGGGGVRRTPSPPAPSPNRRGGAKRGLSIPSRPSPCWLPLSLWGRGRGGGVASRRRNIMKRWVYAGTAAA